MTTRLLIVSGLSGAGKTTAVRSLEDLGYFVVDNLPPALMPKFVELWDQSVVKKFALVVDIRGGEFFSAVFDALKDLDNKNISYEILFLEASDETLVRRYKASRRRHPLSGGEVLEDIKAERALLKDLRGKANKIIDTSQLTEQQLKNEIYSIYGEWRDENDLFITVMSFGFKHGIPLDSDLVMDVRFLPNPYYVPELRNLTGNDPAVQQHVCSSEVTTEFKDKLSDMVAFLVPHYIKEGKATLMIAIGCTGGMHRSVTLANWLGDLLRKKGYKVAVRHRDIKNA
ncbi:RNase adapter RapZ [Desulfofalx alkaliphila]|uniref:RNase adapter RapZ n=1 Tax=Desulfofalx alkaliphila TaxID=105483 RepID=UPI0004E1D03C|nr:RNase adapter RapZ [Desulfofalx alkaliphila]